MRAPRLVVPLRHVERWDGRDAARVPGRRDWYVGRLLGVIVEVV
jgi:hypothetical protein